MKRPLLTIAIPTFNGSKTIDQALNSVFSQIHLNNKTDIEIIISDNASTDGTIEVIDALDPEKREAIKYFTNTSNVGFDRNIALLFERATGTYILPLADDDYLEDGALDAILSFLHFNPQVDVYFIGGVVKPFSEENLIFNNGNEFFSTTEFRNGGVSSNIFKRSTWNQVEIEKYYDCDWIHFAVLIDILEKGCGAIARTEYVREIPFLEKKWGGGGQFIIVGLKLAIIFAKMDHIFYTKAVRRKALNVIHGPFYFSNIIRAKSKGFVVDIPTLKTFILLFKHYPTFWLFDFPALMLPASVCRKLLHMRAWLRSRLDFTLNTR